SGRRKIEVAQAVMGTLLKSLPAEVSLGLVTFGRNRKNDCQDIEMLVPIGTDRAAFMKAVNTLDPKGDTPLTGAMQFATNQLREVENQTSVIVVSDGKESCGGDPCAVVRDAMAQGIRMQVHVVGFDVSEEEAAQLRCIAKAGNGKYFAAANAEQLGTALAEATKEVVPPPPPPPSPPKLKKVLFEDQYERAELGQDYEIFEPDPNRMALNEGKLLIVATRPLKNLVLTSRTLPGDFVVTVAVTMQITYGNQPGLYYWVDENNYLVIAPFGQCCPSARRAPRFTKIVSGQENTIEPDTGGLTVKSFGTRDISGYATQPEIWYLQLERTGVKYTGRMSVDGKQWTDIGTHTVLQKGGRLGFSALSGGEIENAAEFDNFVVQGAE
ncbi:MAG: VWA domain-containing protein, partial [Candidatus Binatia bacterium]